MQIPQIKLTLGANDYTSEIISASAELKENNFSNAKIVLDNYKSKFYTSLVNTFTEVKLYFKDYYETAYTQVFGGYVRELLPFLSEQGSTLTLGCKGYGAALEETTCNRNYGLESENTSLNTCKEIWDDIITDYVNKSFDDWSTNHALLTSNGGNDLIADIQAATDITYINNPYRKNLDVFNHVCDLATAIASGADAENPAAAGPHWIVDSAKHVIVNTIGAHEDATEWPDWWNTDQAGSTLTEGVDFKSLQVIDKSSEFANNVILVTDFRHPAYDYWTTDAVANSLWDTEDAILTDNAAEQIVGNDCLRVEHDAVITGYAFYPSGEDAGWNVERWGSEKNPPRLNFYFQQDSDVLNAYVVLFTTDHKTDAYVMDFADWTLSDDEWHHFSIPIGPYWASIEETRDFKWSNGHGGTPIAAGAPDWTNINGVCFLYTKSAGDPLIYLDDLHFSGKVVRSAYVSDNITANKEYQKVFISRHSMDDSCIATDDTGDAGRIAKAELLRRILNPYTVSFSVDMKTSFMAGQKLHPHSGLKLDGSYVINADMRAMTVTHDWSSQGAYTNVTATSDLFNSRPVSSGDRWALQQEFTLINSAEAKNMRAAAEVDLLIPILKKNYT